MNGIQKTLHNPDSHHLSPSPYNLSYHGSEANPLALGLSFLSPSFYTVATIAYPPSTILHVGSYLSQELIMLVTRSLWLRCGCAVLIVGVLLLATLEHGFWDSAKLRLGASLSGSRHKYESTILRGIDTGKGSKIVVMGKMTKDNTTWVQTELPE